MWATATFFPSTYHDSWLEMSQSTHVNVCWFWWSFGKVNSRSTKHMVFFAIIARLHATHWATHPMAWKLKDVDSIIWFWDFDNPLLRLEGCLKSHTCVSVYRFRVRFQPQDKIKHHIYCCLHLGQTTAKKGVSWNRGTTSHISHHPLLDGIFHEINHPANWG